MKSKVAEWMEDLLVNPNARTANVQAVLDDLKIAFKKER